MESGVAIGLTSIPLTVVKSFFQYAFFASSGSRTSRRHRDSCFSTPASASAENRGSCSSLAFGGVGGTGTGVGMSVSLRLMLVSVTTIQNGCNLKLRLLLSEERAQALLRLAEGEQAREFGALEAV